MNLKYTTTRVSIDITKLSSGDIFSMLIAGKHIKGIITAINGKHSITAMSVDSKNNMKTTYTILPEHIQAKCNNFIMYAKQDFSLTALEYDESIFRTNLLKKGTVIEINNNTHLIIKSNALRLITYNIEMNMELRESEKTKDEEVELNEIICTYTHKYNVFQAIAFEEDNICNIIKEGDIPEGLREEINFVKNNFYI